MKLLSLLPLFIFATATLVSGLSNAGVNVGNASPVNSYWSPQGNFGVRYASSLSLRVINKASFEISNPRLLQASEPLSKITFVVTNGVVSSIDQLPAYLKQNFPQRDFQPLALPGATGFASELRTADHLDALYFLLTSNADLVHVTVDAFSAGAGLSWVAPIVHSFTYDVTPPQFQAVQIKSTNWPAGHPQKLYFHSTDDNSGVGPFASYASLTRTGGGKDIWMASSGSLVDEGAGWYSLAIPVSVFQTPGTYCVDDLQITDHAGNFADIKPDATNPDHFLKGDTSSAEIPNACVTVKNSGKADSSAPQLREIRASETSWNTDRSYELHLRITDDVSGVDVKTLDCWDEARDYSCSSPKAEGGDWYSIKVTPNRYAPTHSLRFGGIWVADRAGNEVIWVDDENKPAHYESFSPTRNSGRLTSALPVFNKEVKNTTTVDVTSPEILAVEMPAIVKAGEVTRIRFQARDDASGIALRPVVDDQTWGFLDPASGDTSEVVFRLLTVVPEGGEWYHVDFRVSPYVAAGDYFLRELDVEDRARNIARLQCSDGVPSPKPLPFCLGAGSRQIPAVHVHIVR